MPWLHCHVPEREGLDWRQGILGNLDQIPGEQQEPSSHFCGFFSLNFIYTIYLHLFFCISKFISIFLIYHISILQFLYTFIFLFIFPYSHALLFLFFHISICHYFCTFLYTSILPMYSYFPPHFCLSKNNFPAVFPHLAVPRQASSQP